MAAGIFNIVIGLVFLVGAAMNEISFLGLSREITMAVGGAVAGLGGWQLVRQRRGR